MTTAERRALLFLAAVGTLGAGARLVGAGGGAPPSVAERAALDAQLDRVEAARDSAREARRGRGRGRGRRVGRAGRQHQRHQDRSPSPHAAFSQPRSDCFQ